MRLLWEVSEILITNAVLALPLTFHNQFMLKFEVEMRFECYYLFLSILAHNLCK